MISFFRELKQRNPVLFYSGWISFVGAIVCFVLMLINNTIVLGINAWIKPMKFFLSTTIFCWTIGWYIYYLQWKRKQLIYSWMVFIVLGFELVVVTWQAANGRLSHFNISSSFYLLLFNLMGVAITILTLWTAYIGYLFFRQKQFNIPRSYLWGIRLGIIYFVIFCFEGGLMAARLSHTVGAADGGEGLPLLNWSRGYGDLRIAHFFGMHSLQVLPLAGYFVFKTTRGIIIFSLVYLALLVGLTVMALNAIPII
ncbi:MAG: hypothetical protein H7Y31_13975 [Chitinophagaceae bacterium]|nr:hypothetical protein [Chitinophagaceae bacterium]